MIINSKSDLFKDYSSNAIKSVGTKTLEFTLIDNVFKISGEIFSK